MWELDRSHRFTQRRSLLARRPDNQPQQGNDGRPQTHGRELRSEGPRREDYALSDSRQRSGKTLTEHRADRATVVREALLSAGIVAPETERMAADVTMPDGTPRFVWTDTHPDQAT
jgi:hypothetical protein